MKYNRYKFEDIEIGDEVYFDSVPAQSNHDLYWQVIDKLDKEKRLIVQLNEMGFTDERWAINADDVRQIIKKHEKS